MSAEIYHLRDYRRREELDAFCLSVVAEALQGGPPLTPEAHELADRLTARMSSLFEPVYDCQGGVDMPSDCPA